MSIRLSVLFVVSCTALFLAGPVGAEDTGGLKKFNLGEKLRQLGGSLKLRKPAPPVSPPEYQPRMVILDPRQRPGDDHMNTPRPVSTNPSVESEPADHARLALACQAPEGLAKGGSAGLKSELVGILKILRPHHYEAILGGLRIDPGSAQPGELTRLATFIKMALDNEPIRTAGRRGRSER